MNDDNKATVSPSRPLIVSTARDDETWSDYCHKHPDKKSKAVYIHTAHGKLTLRGACQKCQTEMIYSGWTRP